LAEAGITLLADNFSLAERGIGAAELHRAVQESSVEALVDVLVADGTKVIWH